MVKLLNTPRDGGFNLAVIRTFVPVVDVTEAGALHGGERPRAGERALAHPDGVPALEALLLPRPRLGAPAQADEDHQQRHGHHGDQRIHNLLIDWWKIKIV